MPDLPLSRVAFSCRLPVFDSKTGGDFVTLQGGFVTFPQAANATDPNGTIRSEYVAQDFVTNATPILHGTGGGAFYDAAFKRWVPVDRGQASPDGTGYAYMVSGSSPSDVTRIHIVHVADGTERVVTIKPPPQTEAVGWVMGDFDGAAVYLEGAQVDNLPGGVWRVDLSTGAIQRLTGARYVQLVQSGYAWVGVMNPNDTSPPNPGKGEAFDSLARVDLKTGVETTWIYRQGQGVFVLGLDATGLPVVRISTFTSSGPTDVEMRVLSSPGGSGTEIASGSAVTYLGPQPDAGRLWFGSDRGLYLWTASSGLQKVFAFQGDPILGESLTPAGRCA